MTFRKRFLTALTAAALSVSSVPAVLNAPVTAATSNTIYDDFDIVPYYMFETDSSTEAQDKLERAFRTATKKDVGSITFADLQKVTSLNLSNMELEGVPEAIEYMVRLRTLNLSNNLLRSSDLNSVDLSGCISLIFRPKISAETLSAHRDSVPLPPLPRFTIICREKH